MCVAARAQAAAALESMGAWGWQLPLEALERGNRRAGNLARLQRVLHQALAGEPIHVVTMGGSITGKRLAREIRRPTPPSHTCTDCTVCVVLLLQSWATMESDFSRS